MIIYKTHPQVRLQVKLMYMQYACVKPQKKRHTHTHTYIQQLHFTRTLSIWLIIIILILNQRTSYENTS